MQAQLALILPLQTVDVERGFSAQNSTKTVHRNGGRNIRSLHYLMKIGVEDFSVESYDFRKAVLLWEGKKGKTNYPDT